MNEEINGITNRSEKMKQKLDNQIETNKILEKENADLKNQVLKIKLDLSQEIKNTNSIQDSFDNYKKATKEKYSKLQEIANDFDNMKEDMDLQYKILENELKSLKMTSSVSENAIKQDLEAANNKIKELESIIDESKQELQSQEEKRKSLEEEINLLNNNKKDLENKLKEKKQNKSVSQSNGNSTIYPKYIRKVLLQFFLQDGSTRESLIPVILNLVECDDKLIQQAKRRWAESNQLFSFSFFSKK